MRNDTPERRLKPAATHDLDMSSRMRCSAARLYPVDLIVVKYDAADKENDDVSD